MNFSRSNAFTPFACALAVVLCSNAHSFARPTPRPRSRHSSRSSQARTITPRSLHVHEAKGDQTQDRVYSYEFMKPHYAKTLILDGDGKGSGGVWTGGDQVSGHQGGILSGFHLKVNIHDPRAVSLRGVTIPEGLLQRIVENYATIPGKLVQQDGGKIGGVPHAIASISKSPIPLQTPASAR